MSQIDPSSTLSDTLVPDGQPFVAPPWPLNSGQSAELSARIAVLLASIPIDRSFFDQVVDAAAMAFRTGSEQVAVTKTQESLGLELCVQVSVRKILKTSEFSKPKTEAVSPRSKWSW